VSSRHSVSASSLNYYLIGVSPDDDIFTSYIPSHLWLLFSPNDFSSHFYDDAPHGQRRIIFFSSSRSKQKADIPYIYDLDRVGGCILSLLGRAL